MPSDPDVWPNVRSPENKLTGLTLATSASLLSLCIPTRRTLQTTVIDFQDVIAQSFDRVFGFATAHGDAV